MLWYSLEAPQRGASNEYPQHMFSWRNKKNHMWIPPLICSYVKTSFSQSFVFSEVSNKTAYANSVDPDQTAPLFDTIVEIKGI